MKILLIFLACVFIAANITVGADIYEHEILDTDWKKSLAELLVQFPSIFDRLYVEYNYEHKKTPVDAWTGDDSEGRLYSLHPFEVKFYDLDGDNIPEVYILFALPESDAGSYKVYKYNGEKYNHVYGIAVQDGDNEMLNYGIGIDCRGVMQHIYYLYEHKVILSPMPDISPQTGENNILKIAALILTAAIYKKYPIKRKNL